MRSSGDIGNERRAQIELEILETMKRLKKAGEGFELLIAPGEESVWSAVLENLMRANPDFAVVMWPSGPGVVRRRDIDAINPDFKKINEAAGFIVNGGESFKADDIDPRVTGGEAISSKEYAKQMPDAADAYGIPELGRRE